MEGDPGRPGFALQPEQAAADLVEPGVGLGRRRPYEMGDERLPPLAEDRPVMSGRAADQPTGHLHGIAGERVAAQGSVAACQSQTDADDEGWGVPLMGNGSGNLFLAFANGVPVRNPNAGKILYDVGTPRQIQFALKLTF